MNYKYLLFFLLFFIFPFFSVHASNQITDVVQANYDSTLNFGWNNTGSTRYFAQSFKPNVSLISGINLRLGRNGSCPSVNPPLKIGVCDDYRCFQGTGNILAYRYFSTSECESLLPLNSTSVINISFSSSTNLTINNTYYIVEYFNDYNSGNWGKLDYQNTDIYSNGDYFSNINGSWSTSTKDIYFETYYDQPIIQAISPESLISYKDFPNFQFDYDYSTSSLLYLTVYYGLSSSSPEFNNSEIVSSGFYRYAISKTHQLSNGTYFYYGTLSTSDINLATSSIIQFDIDNQNGIDNFTGGVIYTSTSSLSDLNTSCDSASNLFTNSLCNLFYFLFIPSQAAINSFSSIQDLLLQKKPFNYYEEAKTIYNNISISSSTTPSFSVNNINFTSTSTADLSLLDFDKTFNLIGESSKDLFYNLCKYSLWFYFLYYIYIRLTNIFAPHQMSLF